MRPRLSPWPILIGALAALASVLLAYDLSHRHPTPAAQAVIAGKARGELDVAQAYRRPEPPGRRGDWPARCGRKPIRRSRARRSPDPFTRDARARLARNDRLQSRVDRRQRAGLQRDLSPRSRPAERRQRLRLKDRQAHPRPGRRRRREGSFSRKSWEPGSRSHGSSFSWSFSRPPSMYASGSSRICRTAS